MHSGDCDVIMTVIIVMAVFFKRLLQDGFPDRDELCVCNCEVLNKRNKKKETKWRKRGGRVREQ